MRKALVADLIGKLIGVDKHRNDRCQLPFEELGLHAPSSSETKGVIRKRSLLISMDLKLRLLIPFV
jgi:hypothetical protein